MNNVMPKMLNYRPNGRQRLGRPFEDTRRGRNSSIKAQLVTDVDGNVYSIKGKILADKKRGETVVGIDSSQTPVAWMQ
jgi:hypothetical protein